MKKNFLYTAGSLGFVILGVIFSKNGEVYGTVLCMFIGVCVFAFFIGSANE